LDVLGHGTVHAPVWIGGPSVLDALLVLLICSGIMTILPSSSRVALQIALLSRRTRRSRALGPLVVRSG